MKRSSCYLSAVLTLAALLCGALAGCRAEVTPPPLSSQSSSTVSDDGDTAARDEMISDYYRTRLGWQTTPAADAPDTPQAGDARIDKLTCLGETPIYESVWAAYQMEMSLYTQKNGVLDWQEVSPHILVLSRSGYDGTFQEVVGQPEFNTDGMAAEDVIKQMAWGLADLNVCLFRDGYPNPVGPGSWTELFNYAYEGEPTVEVLEDAEPIYQDGDYWDRWSLEGFTATRYYNATDGIFSANTIDVTRADLYTPRGIRVGSTRAEVLAAYPELFDTPYWHDDAPDFPGTDYLWYCGNDEGWGASMLFFFEEDAVKQIRLINFSD